MANPSNEIATVNRNNPFTLPFYLMPDESKDEVDSAKAYICWHAAKR